MIKPILLLFVCIGLSVAFGQAIEKLSLSEAYEMMEGQYPALRNAELLQEVHQLEHKKIDISGLPTLYVKADGRLQSESINLEAEGVQLPFEINRPLYSINGYLEAQYMLLDGGMKKAQRKLLDSQLKLDLQQLEVESFSLRERVNGLILGIILLREQKQVLDYSLKDLNARKEAVAAGVELGSLLESELSKINVRILEISGTRDELDYRIRGMVGSLSYLVGKELAPDVQFELPVFGSLLMIPELNRPEQKLFGLQREAILAKNELALAENKAKLSFFAQGGVGNPNPLNILENSTAPYALVGAQFSWKLIDWKKAQTQQEILALQAQQILHAEETFTFNMDSQKANYLADVKRLQAQLDHDQEIARLQSNILGQMAAQLEEGVITSATYISQVNEDLRARQQILIHQTELLRLQLEFWNERAAY